MEENNLVSGISENVSVQIRKKGGMIFLSGMMHVTCGIL